MIDLEGYRLCIRQLLSERARLVGNACIQAETVFDRARDRYLLIHVGWLGTERIYDPILHIDIYNNQIWIQKDETAAGIANDLIQRGIPATAIVLGFRTAIVRDAALQA
ncbi:MAG: XisI protein [Cyanobacteria bacterium J06641_5]